jgi:hypothetical protein
VNRATTVPHTLVHSQISTTGANDASTVPAAFGCGTTGGKKKKCAFPELCLASEIANDGGSKALRSLGSVRLESHAMTPRQAIKEALTMECMPIS